MGWPVEENFTKQKTAFRAVVTRPEKAVLKVALLAEYDALPDIGHGCGHSANGAMSFLAAAALSKVKDLPGRRTKSCAAARLLWLKKAYLRIMI